MLAGGKAVPLPRCACTLLEGTGVLSGQVSGRSGTVWACGRWVEGRLLVPRYHAACRDTPNVKVKQSLRSTKHENFTTHNTLHVQRGQHCFNSAVHTYVAGTGGSATSPVAHAWPWGPERHARRRLASSAATRPPHTVVGMARSPILASGTPCPIISGFSGQRWLWTSSASRYACRPVGGLPVGTLTMRVCCPSPTTTSTPHTWPPASPPCLHECRDVGLVFDRRLYVPVGCA